jgi:hypothetical protein
MRTMYETKSIVDCFRAPCFLWLLAELSVSCFPGFLFPQTEPEWRDATRGPCLFVCQSFLRCLPMAEAWDRSRPVCAEVKLDRLRARSRRVDIFSSLFFSCLPHSDIDNLPARRVSPLGKVFDSAGICSPSWPPPTGAPSPFRTC